MLGSHEIGQECARKFRVVGWFFHFNLVGPGQVRDVIRLNCDRVEFLLFQTRKILEFEGREIRLMLL